MPCGDRYEVTVTATNFVLRQGRGSCLYEIGELIDERSQLRLRSRSEDGILYLLICPTIRTGLSALTTTRSLSTLTGTPRPAASVSVQPL